MRSGEWAYNKEQDKHRLNIILIIKQTKQISLFSFPVTTPVMRTVQTMVTRNYTNDPTLDKVVDPRIQI